jgi:8-oxo-dGTP pyrophosphatase MutT (NUDIX family)
MIEPDRIRKLFAANVSGMRQSASRGDDGVNAGDGNPGLLPPTARFRAAAVLVPLVARASGMSVLLTRRTAHLHAHAGQISFPGGRVEDGDADAVAAALRETEEEIGLARARVEIVGRLDTYRTRTAFEVTPVVGIVTPPFELKLDAFEVDSAFEVPLSFALDPANHQRHSRVFEGATRHFWALPFGPHYIWGATAGMLVNLAEALGTRPPS